LIIRPPSTSTPFPTRRSSDLSFDVNGALIRITDPATGQPFPGNAIPRDRLNRLGQAILNYYPLPNFTDPDPRNLYRWNLRSVYRDRKSTRLNSSHVAISYAVF